MKQQAQAEKDTADTALVKLAVTGDRAAFAIIYRRFEDRVRGTMFRIAGADELDDLTQECFLKVWRNIHKVKDADFLGTWIYRVAVNTALDRVRKKTPVFTTNGPEQTVGPGQENTRMVAELLANLKPDARAVLVLCDMQGCSREEASKILEIPVGTVKSRLSHARDAARQFLNDKEVPK